MSDIDLHRLVLPERAVEHVLVRVIGGFRGRELIEFDQALHQRMVARELVDGVFGDQVNAAVADVRDVGKIADNDSGSESCAAIRDIA